MSDGSFWPKTWDEAVPLLVWGVLIFAFGFEGVASLLHAEWWQSAFGFLGMVGLTAMLIHSNRIKENFRDIRWLVAASMVALVVVALSPYVEEKRWPFSGANDYSLVTSPVPDGASHMEIWQHQAEQLPDGVYDLVLKVINSGKTDAKNFGHIGYVLIPKKPISEYVLISQFILLRAEFLLYPDLKSENSIEPGNKSIYFSAVGPRATPELTAAINNGTAFPYLLLLMRYRDKTTPKNKFIYTEVCRYWVKKEMHDCETGHNKSYLAK